ncbi:hypothetical protein [Chryseobacterium indoltheticum]|uniref:hypothetical protein n=1 Tax=Chryseobacterium indoltheticum TaxID=254 RepID=UPI003F49459D
MKKIITGFTVGISATIALIYLSGYGYIFKAIGINLKKDLLLHLLMMKRSFLPG